MSFCTWQTDTASLHAWNFTASTRAKVSTFAAEQTPISSHITAVRPVAPQQHTVTPNAPRRLFFIKGRCTSTSCQAAAIAGDTTRPESAPQWQMDSPSPLVPVRQQPARQQLPITPCYGPCSRRLGKGIEMGLIAEVVTGHRRRPFPAPATSMSITVVPSPPAVLLPCSAAW
jgi:hypothetical protein